MALKFRIKYLGTQSRFLVHPSYAYLYMKY